MIYFQTLNMVEQDQHAIYLLESLKKIYEVNKLSFLFLNNFKIGWMDGDRRPYRPLPSPSWPGIFPSVSDPDPVGSVSFDRIRIRIRKC